MQALNTINICTCTGEGMSVHCIRRAPQPQHAWTARQTSRRGSLIESIVFAHAQMNEWYFTVQSHQTQQEHAGSARQLSKEVTRRNFHIITHEALHSFGILKQTSMLSDGI